MHDLERIRIERCDGCGVYRTQPFLEGEALTAFYQEEYWRSSSPSVRGYADYAGDADLHRATFRRKLRHLLPHVRPGARLLEVGAAAGYFLDVARDAGFDVFGTEIGVPMARLALERHPGRVAIGTIDALPSDLELFDGAVLFDVVEHCDDPVALLHEVAGTLRPDGLLLLTTQDAEAPFARLLGRRWHHFKQEHLYHFSPTTMPRLLQVAGFDLLSITHRDAGKYVPFDFVVERSARVHRWLPRLLGAIPFAGRKGIWVNPGDEMLVVARRRDRSRQ